MAPVGDVATVIVTSNSAIRNSDIQMVVKAKVGHTYAFGGGIKFNNPFTFPNYKTMIDQQQVKLLYACFIFSEYVILQQVTSSLAVQLDDSSLWLDN